MTEQDEKLNKIYSEAYIELHKVISEKNSLNYKSYDDEFYDFTYSNDELKFIPKLTHSKSMGMAALEWEKED